jgi:transposase-like protein
MAWLQKHLHPEGQQCPHCQAGREAARLFRVNRGSGLPVWRCGECDGVYHLYSGTVFEGSQLKPAQAVLLLRGVVQGQSSKQIGREIGLTEKTVLKWRHRLQANAERLQPDTPLPDQTTESDEMFQNAGEKRRKTPRPRRPAPSPSQQTAWARDV